jgi:hypothetical protein
MGLCAVGGITSIDFVQTPSEIAARPTKDRLSIKIGPGHGPSLQVLAFELKLQHICLENA